MEVPRGLVTSGTNCLRLASAGVGVFTDVDTDTDADGGCIARTSVCDSATTIARTCADAGDIAITGTNDSAHDSANAAENLGTNRKSYECLYQN